MNMPHDPRLFVFQCSGVFSRLCSNKVTPLADDTTGSDVTTTGSDVTTTGSDVTTTGSDGTTTGSDGATTGSDVTTTGSDVTIVTSIPPSHSRRHSA